VTAPAEVADILVIGAGIAGSSVAAELAARANVILLERESQPGYHATGRSAAFFEPGYGNSVARGMTALSEAFFRRPPEDFTDVELIRPRDCLFVARQDQLDALESQLLENPALERISAAEARAAMPLLAADYVAAALKQGGGGDLDVDAILQGYLRLFRRRGGVLQTDTEVVAIERCGGNWEVETSRETFRAPLLVNAGGAWADEIATLAGPGALGLQPLRRTALLIDVPGDLDGGDWAMVGDIEETFYFKPDAGQLLISPADETPAPASDAGPEELDVALAVDRFERVTGTRVQRVNHRWAGLRTFAPDRSFVVGFDPRAAGFFWLAGQGGYGVQSAPALSQLACALITGSEPAAAGSELMHYAGQVSPQRLIDRPVET
jgi:D-arginine dehydrogenase